MKNHMLLKVRMIRETAKVYQFEYEDETYWIPKSCVFDVGQVPNKPGEFIVTVQNSILSEKGIL